MPNIDYYKILGLPSTCTMNEVKQAYRDLARKYHPDNGDTGNDGLMKLVNEAYAILGNPEKRLYYDRYGEASLEPVKPSRSKTTHQTTQKKYKDPMRTRNILIGVVIVAFLNIGFFQMGSHFIAVPILFDIGVVWWFWPKIKKWGFKIPKRGG